MKTNLDEHKLKQIFECLQEFASGCTSARVETSCFYKDIEAYLSQVILRQEKQIVNTSRLALNDEIDILIQLINYTLAKVATFFYHHGFVNLTENYDYTPKWFLLINTKSQIVTLNPSFKKALGYESHDLEGMLFTHILTADSKAEWGLLSSKPFKENLITLSFKTKQEFTLPVTCLVDAVEPTGNVIITMVEVVKQSEQSKKALYNSLQAWQNNPDPIEAARQALPMKYKTNLSREDKAIITKVHAYLKCFITESFNKPMPTNKQLAAQFGISENRLKSGFKQQFGQFPYRLFKKEFIQHRLAYALQLLQKTQLPVNRIASVTGFKNFSNFSFNFKRAYNITPREARNKFHKKNTPL